MDLKTHHYVFQSYALMSFQNVLNYNIFDVINKYKTRVSFQIKSFMQIYAQEWDCWIIWEFYIFFKEPKCYSP